MKVLVVGSGGREHAIAAALARSPSCDEVFCAPGNPGTHKVATNIDLGPDKLAGLVEYVDQKGIDLTIIGPEAPLVEGLADRLRKRGCKVVGPSKLAAQLEGSKIFAKQFMRRHNIPTSDFWHFHHLNDAHRFLENSTYPVVVKADGLAQGKGSFICETPGKARGAVDELMSYRKFAGAGDRIIIEHYIDGQEISLFCLTDGHNLMILPTAQDYKRLYDGDEGPNTGGMGAVSPAPNVTQKQLQEIERKILIPTIHGMQIEETPYTGILYLGLMLTKVGPRVLEYNCRLGDPEAQAILARYQGDFAQLMLHAASGTLDQAEPQWDDRHACTVVVAADGYPETPKVGPTIKGLDCLVDKHSAIHYAATRKSAGKVIVDGGRVLSLTSLGEDLSQARERVYSLLANIDFKGMQYRSDIGR